MNRHDVIIVGGGISGATLLHRLASCGVDVMLIERGDRLGGVIWSHRSREGLLVETGANSATINPELQMLVDELALTDELIRPGEGASNRYVVRQGRLLPTPTDPRTFLRTPLFSRRAKLRVLRDLLIAPASADIEESVAGFVERRLGREFLDYAIDPFVGGVFSGCPDRLSLRYAFPAMYQLEQEHGSLIRGAIRKGRSARRARRMGPPPAPKGMASFTEGMGVLPARIAERWREKIIVGARVDRIEEGNNGWRVEAGDRTHAGARLVIATEAPAAASLLESTEPGLSAALRSIEYPPVTVAVSQYDRSAIRHPLDGFGMLIPSVEGRTILGTLFSSSLFPNRAPDKTVLLTTFVGGARNPDMARRPDEELEYFVHRDLQALLGISARALAFDLHRWEHAIPQYTLGYGRILEAIDAAESRHRSLHLLGNYRGGISVGDCVRSAFAMADALIARMGEEKGEGIEDRHIQNQEA